MTHKEHHHDHVDRAERERAVRDEDPILDEDIHRDHVNRDAGARPVKDADRPVHDEAGHHDEVHENAPYNPLSPHADDPAFEPAPPIDEHRKGHGGEYDQTPYRVRAGEDPLEEPEGEGEYDQKPYLERREARRNDDHPHEGRTADDTGEEHPGKHSRR